MSNFKAECRKFQPNIFNKIKCSNCFRQREEHSAEALESNRASRKVSKCGYLFVAPDWDFSNPLNRTKRWQRRWFVLFDDGELTYSVDDLPATIPQGVIDMNRVLEVSEAEDVTGNQFALAITSPDRATFVKGTCREESRWWRDVLSVFPRSTKQHGRYKRNATFPGIKSSSSIQSRSSLGRTASPSLAPSYDPAPSQRVRFHSCTSESFNVGRPSSAPTLGGQDDVFPTKDSPPILGGDSEPSPPSPLYHSTPMTSLPPSTRLLNDEHKENTPPYIEDYQDNPPTSESPPTQDKVLGHRPRTRRTAKREARGLVNPRSELTPQVILSNLEETKREEKLKDIAHSLTRPRGSVTSLAYLGKENGVKPTRESDASPEQTKLSHLTFDDVTDTSLTEQHALMPTLAQIRGDPDGCGLDGDSNPFPATSDTQRVDLPAEDILYIKKGWLLKQGFSQDWGKHWFVLEGSGFKFYRDPSAEGSGILDGIIDLGLVKDVQEKEVGRNYGFVVTTWDDKKFIFSAVTCGIRTNWIQAMRNAANLKTPLDRPLTLGEKLEREIRANTDTCDSSFASVEAERDQTSTSTLSKSLLSSEDDFKTASDSSFFKDLSREDVSSYDRVSLRPCSRGVSKASPQRSRSSPPPSRRGTREDFPPPSPPKGTTSSSCLSEADSVSSMLDLDRHLTPERDSNGTLASTGEGMLVDLLETQVESLKAKLEQTQVSDLQTRILTQEQQINDKNMIISKIENIRKQLQEERRGWESKMAAEESKVRELVASEGKHADIVRTLTRSLKEAELKVISLTQELGKTSSGLRASRRLAAGDTPSVRAENGDLKNQVCDLTKEVSRLKEALKSEKSEAYKWKDLVKELRSLLDGRTEDMELKRGEMTSLRAKLKATQGELDATADRLHRGIEENEALCGRLRELERSTKVRKGSSCASLSGSRERSSSKKALPRMDSLSDLTNFDLGLDPDELQRECLVEEYSELRVRFERAVGEIRALKKEVRAAQALQDDVELSNRRLQGETKAQAEDYEAQILLMGTRLQDLTSKLTTSEKQVRTLKQKVTRTESRERRRTLSLKGKESFSLSKDLESKLSQLEAKVSSLCGTEESVERSEARRSKSFEDAAKRSRARRKSLDGQTADDALKAVVRVNALEDKVYALSGRDLRKASNTSLSSNPESLPPGGALPSISRAKSPLISPLRSPASPRKASITRATKVASEKVTKLTRSESEPRLLKEKVAALERVLSTVQAKLIECQTCAKSLSCACSCGGDSLARLQELLSSCDRASQCRQSTSDMMRLRPLTLRLEDLLKDKMSQLAQKRSQLRAAGKWTREAQLKGFAERLAFETVLLTQLAQALHAPRSPTASFEDALRLQDLIEAHRKLSFLERRLTDPTFHMDPQNPLEFYSNLLAEKLVVEGEVMGAMGSSTKEWAPSQRPPSALTETCKDLQARLLQREHNLAALMTKYKEEKLTEMAVVMARETLMGTQPALDDSVLVEEARLREAWGLAQDLLTREVASLEASQAVLRMTHLLGGPSQDHPSLAAHRSAASLDRLHAGAEESLRQEMEESVFTLSRKYEEVLARHRGGDTEVLGSASADMATVLAEFAAVLGQKAIVDGQLAVATAEGGGSTTTTETLTIVEDKGDPLEAAGDVVASESHLLMFLGGGADTHTEGLVDSALSQAEFSFIYNKVSAQGASDVSNLVSAFLRNQTSSLKSLNSSASDRDVDTDAAPPASTLTSGGPKKIPPSPKSTRRRAEVARRSRRASDITGMLDTCRQCEDLRQELTRLKRSLEAKRVRRQEAECRKCGEYLLTLKHLEEEHHVAMEALQSQHQAEIDRLRDQVKYDPPTRDSDDELTELKRRLCLLEEGYEAQIAALKKQYQEALGSQSDVCEENIRHRYQREIEHLRDLCEKGLTAMESSHRRQLSDTEAKHRLELQQLQAEKEEALAEETQATLAALDAMRKAHEAEVQKEVAKFKEEFLRRVESGREGEAAHSRLHEEELREVRREILTLSEKYSGKCLEMAAKDQKVEGLQRQLAEARAQAKTLHERNRMLKHRLESHLSHLQGTSEKSAEEMQQQYECELALKNEEISWLNQTLQNSKMHESDLGSLCGRLGQFLEREKSAKEEDSPGLKADLLTPVSLKGEGRHPEDRWNLAEETHRQSLDKLFAKAEVSRSPSCPGLSRFSPFLWDGSRESPIRGPSPLLGMVAQRKKVFEGPPTSKTEC